MAHVAERIECSECFQPTGNILVGHTIVHCPKCGEALRCHSCGTDEPGHEWYTIEDLSEGTVSGMWCSLGCIGSSYLL